jgi:hypothetical protein
MTAAVAELVHYQQSEAEKADAKFAELVDQLADGGDVDPRAATKTIAAAGKSTADVEAELRRRRRVAELQAIIADAGDVAAQKLQLSERLAAHKFEAEKVAARLAEERKAFAQQEAELNDRYNRADTARRELRRIVPVSQARAELEARGRKLAADIGLLQTLLHGSADPRKRRPAIEQLNLQIAELQANLKAAGLFAFTRRGTISQLDTLTAKRDDLAKFDGYEKNYVALDAAHAELDAIRKQRAELDG